MKRLLMWLNRGIILPALALLILLLWLLFTQPGLRLTLHLTEKVLPQFQVETAEGAWLTGLTLRQLTYHDQQYELNLEHLRLRLQKRCLLQFRLCLPELELSGLTFNQLQAASSDTRADNSTNAPVASAGLGIAFPIPLRIDKLTLNDVSVHQPEQQLGWKQFSISANAWGNRLQLSEGRLDGFRLILPANGDTAPPTSYVPPILPQIELPFSIFLDDFQMTNAEVRQGLQHHHLALLKLSAQLTPQQIRLLDLALQHSSLRAQGSGNFQLSNNYPLDMQWEMELTDSLLVGQRVQTRLTGDLARLALQLRADGPVTLEVDAEMALLTPDLPLQLTARADTLSWPFITPEYQLSNSQLQLSGSLSDLQLQLAAEVSGNSIPSSQLKLDANWFNWQQQVKINDLTLNTLQGEIQVQGEVALQPELSWQLKLALSNITPEQYWPDFPGLLNGDLEVAGQYQPATGLNLSLPNLALQGELRALPLRLQGALELSTEKDFKDWQFSSPGLQLQHGNNQLTVKGELAESWRVDTIIDLPDLAKSHPALAGKLAGSATLRGAAKQPQIAVQLKAERLAVAGARLRDAALDASIDLANDWQTELSLQLQQGRWQGQRLQQLQLNLAGNQQQHQLQLELTADALHTELTASGSLQPTHQWRGKLEQTRIASPLGKWQLEAPLALNLVLDSQNLTVGTHCWLQQDTKLCLTEPAKLSPQQVNAQLQLVDYELENLNTILPQQTAVAGTLQADVSVNWQQNQAPTAKLTLQIPTGQLTQQFDVPVTLPWRGLELTTELAEHQLRSSLRMQLSDTGQLQAQALVNNLDQTQRPLRAELTLSDLSFEFLKPLLDEYSELKGVLSSRISVDGTLAEPQLQGEARLAGVKVSGKLAPTDIEQADVLLQFRGDRAELEGLVKTPEGQIELVGLANWQDLAAWRASLAVSGDQLRLQVPQAELYVKPDLLLDAEPGRMRLTGLVQIPRATISVDSLPQNAVGLSDDHILLNRQLQPISDPRTERLTIQTDIRLQLGPRVRLEAFGLKSRLTGELRVQQQQLTPTVRGEVSLVDGTFRAYGQDLLIRQGKLTFNGPADQPFLNVEAIRNPVNMEDDVIAGIRVTGPADEPVVAIFSEPAKPQANALSYLVMGKDLDSESGFNANSVTTSLIGMSISSSGKLVGEIGEAFGVSDLMLDTEGAGDNSQVTVSGYLTRDLQLKYGIGIFQPIGQFTLRYRLLRNLYLEAVSGLDNAVDMLYKFEFD